MRQRSEGHNSPGKIFAGSYLCATQSYYSEFVISSKSFVLWWAQQDLNLRPADYESVNFVLSALSSNREKQHFNQAKCWINL